MLNWRELEERAARWANIIATLPGTYCAYVLWMQRHGGGSSLMSYPGFTFAVIVFVVCICIGAILNFLRRSAGPKIPITVVEGSNPMGMTDEQWEQHCASVTYQNTLIDLGRSLEGVFSPVQVDAFRLAKEIREFLNSIGPRPDTDWTSATTSQGIAAALEARWKVQAPWENRLLNGYRLRFPNEIRKLMLRFGENGLSDSITLEPFIDNVEHEGHIRNAAQTLDKLAIELSYLDSPPDPKTGDINAKLYQLEDAEWKKQILGSHNPSFKKWIDEQLSKGL